MDREFLIIRFDGEQYQTIEELTPEQEKALIQEVIRNMTHWRVEYEMFQVGEVRTDASLNDQYRLTFG